MGPAKSESIEWVAAKRFLRVKVLDAQTTLQLAATSTMISWQLRAAVGAELRRCQMAFAQAFGAGAGGYFGMGASRRKFRTNDSGGYRKGSPSHQHHDRGDKASEIGFRRDVAKTHRGQRADGPIYSDRDTGETVLGAFDDVHQGSHYHHDDHDQRQECDGLSPGLP